MLHCKNLDRVNLVPFGCSMKTNTVDYNNFNSEMESDSEKVVPGFVRQMINRFSSGFPNETVPYVNEATDGNRSRFTQNLFSQDRTFLHNNPHCTPRTNKELHSSRRQQADTHRSLTANGSLAKYTVANDASKNSLSAFEDVFVEPVCNGFHRPDKIENGYKNSDRNFVCNNNQFDFSTPPTGNGVAVHKTDEQSLLKHETLVDTPNQSIESPPKKKFVNKAMICLSPKSTTPETDILTSQMSHKIIIVKGNGEVTTKDEVDDGNQIGVCTTDESLALNVDSCKETGNESRIENEDVAEKDGNYFLHVVQQQEDVLTGKCSIYNELLNHDIPEDASGKLRSAIGKANLLVTKKFKQFRELCHDNLTSSDGKQFKVTSEDLAGFWDMVIIQVSDVETSFDELDKLRENNWVERNTSAGSGTKSTNRKASESKPKAGQDNVKPAKEMKSVKTARESSKQKLLAAKEAGRRQRKASETDDVVQIFVSGGDNVH